MKFIVEPEFDLGDTVEPDCFIQICQANEICIRGCGNQTGCRREG